MAEIRVFNPSYTARSHFAREGERGDKSTMAHHRHHRRYARRHNPFGISGSVVKDVMYNGIGAAGSAYIAGFLGQSGWLNVGATIAAAVGLMFAGKSVVGAAESEELLKGGLLMSFIQAARQLGVTVPGLGLYVPSYFSAPTTSDAYGRATAPTIMLPAPSAQAGGKGTSGMGYQRYRSRYQTRF